MTEYIVELNDSPTITVDGWSVRCDDWLIQREEIVRCRDCRHYDPHPTDSGVCFLPDGDGDFARWEVESDGFCKWGERRDA